MVLGFDTRWSEAPLSSCGPTPPLVQRHRGPGSNPFCHPSPLTWPAAFCWWNLRRPSFPLSISFANFRIVSQPHITHRRLFKVRAEISGQWDDLEQRLAHVKTDRGVRRRDLPVHCERHAHPITLDDRGQRLDSMFEIIDRPDDQQPRAGGLGPEQKRRVPSHDPRGQTDR